MTQCLEQVVWTLALTANVGVGVVVDAADNSCMIQLHPTAQFLPEGGKVAAARIVLRGSEYST